MTRARRGMTLMELVIGLAITGIMAAAGVAAFDSIIDHREVIRNASLATERAAALRESIRSWTVGGTVSIVVQGPQMSRATSRRGVSSVTSASGQSLASTTPAQAGGDEFRVTTSAENPAMVPSLAVRFYIDVDGNTPEHGLTMEYQPNPQLPLVRKMLDSTIDTLKVEYLDPTTHRWLAASEAATIRAPTAIRLTMIADPKTSPSPLIGLPLVFTRSPGLSVTILN